MWRSSCRRVVRDPLADELSAVDGRRHVDRVAGRELALDVDHAHRQQARALSRSARAAPGVDAHAPARSAWRASARA